MKPGSVIVDMAAANGGNVEGTVAGETIVTDNGVTIIGYTDLAGRLPTQASQLYGTNLVNLMKLLTPGEGRRARPRLRRRRAALDDRGPRRRADLAAAAGAGVGRAGRRRGCRAARAEQSPAKKPIVDRQAASRSSAARRRAAAGARARWRRRRCSATSRCSRWRSSIGYYVIGHVHHALHTPLMSVTNAISGIIVVGALLQIGHGDVAITALSFVAILLASINVFGGFAVTRRMLAMFSRS